MKAVKILLIGICIYFLASCVKDEYDVLNSNNDIKKEFELLENRTGQDTVVFFDGSGVVGSAADPNHQIQRIINLYNVDSIIYKGGWNNPFIGVQGTDCMIYDISFYENGIIKKQITAAAKWRGIKYKQIIGQLEGWQSDVFDITLLRQNVTENYFDIECLANKLQYRYFNRTQKTDGTFEYSDTFIKSNVCQRNNVVWQRKFKP
jgi:hypothetical protein